jgi:hypothetical protein
VVRHEAPNAHVDAVPDGGSGQAHDERRAVVVIEEIAAPPLPRAVMW